MARTAWTLLLGLAATLLACGHEEPSKKSRPPGDAAYQPDGDGTRREVANAHELHAPPELRVETWVKGDQTNFARLRGKVVLLYFWGCWSEDAMEHLPRLNELHEKLASKGLVILAIHTQRSKDEVERTVEDHKLEFHVVIDAATETGTNGATADSFHIGAIPCLYILDRDGRVRFADLEMKELDRATRYLLAEKAP